MKSAPRPTVSRRNLVRALLGREAPASPPPGAAGGTDRHAAGDAAFAAGDFPGAVAAYRLSIRGDLSNAPVRLRLGHALYALGQFVQARVEFEHVLHVTAGADQLARLSLGLTLLALGKGEKAAATLAAFTDPDRPELERTIQDATRRLAAGEATDLAALRQDIEASAQAMAFLPESGRV